MSVQSHSIPTLNKQAVKVLVAVPTRDMMYAHFSYALQALVKYHAIKKIDTEVEFDMGTLIGNQRERLANKAISIGATHILWLDSDMVFPEDVCERLLSHDVPFVACNYSTRSLPFKAVGYTEQNNWESGIDKTASGLEVVEGIGLGCALTRTEIFYPSKKPWFPITYVVESDDYLGEDMNFCLKITEIGYPIFVDCDLSRHIYHIGSAAYLWNHAPGHPMVDTTT